MIQEWKLLWERRGSHNLLALSASLRFPGKIAVAAPIPQLSRFILSFIPFQLATTGLCPPALPHVASCETVFGFSATLWRRKCSLLPAGALSGRLAQLCDSSEIRKTNTVNGELEKQVGTISPPKRMDLKGNLFMG